MQERDLVHLRDGCNEQVGGSGAAVPAPGGESSLAAVRCQFYAYVDLEVRQPVELVLHREVFGAAARREE